MQNLQSCLADKYGVHGSARLKLDCRKRTRVERDDRVMKKGSTWTRTINRTDDRPRVVRRSHRISSPGFKERKEALALNEYEKVYENQPKTHVGDKAKNYEPPKVYESKPVAHGETKHKIIDNQSTFSEHRPKMPRMQENKPKVQDVKVQEHKVEKTMPEERPLSVADRTRPERFNELSPLMTSMVEEELKNIMIKVWQTLPDDAPKGAEKFVLDKLKNEAGDDLRNTIGLNVTKRLLNVNNNPSQKGLLIKVLMLSTVSSHDVYEFCKTYRIGNFKYLQKRTYAGRMQSWTDLDKLYSTKNLRCGNSKVKVTPIYNFLKCPPMLKTIFDGKQDYASKEIEKDAAKKIKKLEEKTIITADKVLAEDAKKVEAKKEVVSKEKATVKKADVKTEPKKIDTKESPKNVVPKAEDKKPATKPSQTNNVQKETIKQNSIKTDTNVTIAKPTDAAASKPVISSNSKKDIKPGAKVEPPKTSNKPAPTTTAKKETVAPKTVETKSNQKAEPKTPFTQPAKPAVKTTDSVKKEVGKCEENKQASKTVAKVTTSPSPTSSIKEPVKAVVNKPQKIVAKEPAKTAAKEPSKPIAKESLAPVAKDSTKPVAKGPAKPVAKSPAKPVDKESTKPIAKEANPVARKPSIPAKQQTVTPKPPAKKTSPVVPKTAVKTPTKTTKGDVKAKNNSDDFDELDDHDILALLSGGIVLDECSGSDVD